MTFQLKTSTTVGAEAADDELLGATSQRVTFGAVTINADASRYVRIRLSATAAGSSENNTGSGYLFIAGPFAGIYKFTNGGAPNQISGAFSPALSMNSGTFAVQSGSSTYDEDTGDLTLAITIGGTTHTATANDATPLSGTFANLTNYVPTSTDFQFYEWIAAPGAPTAPTATNITDVSATLGCTAPTTGGAVVSYEVDVREFGTTPWTTFSSAGPSRSVTIFESATRYEQRWRALGAGATVSADSAIGDFWTANAVTGGGQIVPVLVLSVAGTTLTVRDEASALVVGAAVVATPGNIALGNTNASGQVSLSSLVPGNYTLTATLNGGAGSTSYTADGGPVVSGTISPSTPRVGQAVTITVSDSFSLPVGDALGTAGAQSIGPSNAQGVITWGPNTAGQITVTVGGFSQVVNVLPAAVETRDMEDSSLQSQSYVNGSFRANISFVGGLTGLVRVRAEYGGVSQEKIFGPGASVPIEWRLGVTTQQVKFILYGLVP